MEVIFILLPLALVIAGLMLALFIWAVKAGQFDDLETPAHRILFDEEPLPPKARRRSGESADNDPHDSSLCKEELKPDEP